MDAAFRRFRRAVTVAVLALAAAFGTAVPGLADPGEQLPDPAELVAVMVAFSDPHVPAVQKAGLVEGGLSEPAIHALDAEMRRAQRHSEFPLSYSAANIVALDPGHVSADIYVSGPKLRQPVERTVRFVRAGDHWILDGGSAIEMIADATG